MRGAKRSKNVGNVEDTLAIDIRALRRLGLAEPGECIIDTVQWSIDGLRAPSARLRVDLSDIERGGTMKVVADIPDGAIEQTIAIDAVPSGFGGQRCYFVCPIDRTRCEVLYYAHGRFASRKAQRLTYAVQGMTELSRAKRKAAKLHSRLEGKNGYARVRGTRRRNAVKNLRLAREFARKLHSKRLASKLGHTFVD